MNINDLTNGQGKELAAMFGANAAAQRFVTPHIGKRCVIRAYASGVFLRRGRRA
ncbi:MAG: hypothetical protein U5N55_01685 [Cypionkella sp.]|nr:hypothetical protein [Cypionkella sp.]